MATLLCVAGLAPAAAGQAAVEIRLRPGHVQERPWQYVGKQASVENDLGTDGRAVVITRQPARSPALTSVTTPLRSLSQVTPAAVGSIVDLDGVKVERIVPGHGFFVSSGSQTVFVHPLAGQVPQVSRGDHVSIDGFVLTLPPGMKDDVNGTSGRDVGVYVFATDIS